MYFLGLRSVVGTAHGSASSDGIANVITYAARGVREHMVEQVESHLGSAASAEPEAAENGPSNRFAESLATSLGHVRSQGSISPWSSSGSTRRLAYGKLIRNLAPRDPSGKDDHLPRSRMPRTLHKAYGATQVVRACRDWPSYFAEYATSADDGRERTYRMRSGAVFRTRRNRMDIRIIGEIFAFRKYDYFGFKVPVGADVVDVGANIGVFTVYALTECGARRVLAFEPHPENYALLVRNVEENGLADRVTCVNAAVAATTGTGMLNVAANNSGGHSLTAKPTSTVIDVELVPLADALEEHEFGRIDYLKLDCEGAEYEIVESASPEVLERIERISMEYHPSAGHRLEDLLDRLVQHGFFVRLTEGHRLYAHRHV